MTTLGPAVDESQPAATSRSSLLWPRVHEERRAELPSSSVVGFLDVVFAVFLLGRLGRSGRRRPADVGPWGELADWVVSCVGVAEKDEVGDDAGGGERGDCEG